MFYKIQIKKLKKRIRSELSQIVKMRLFSIFGFASVAVATNVDEGFDYDSLGLKKPNKGNDAGSEPAEVDKVTMSFHGSSESSYL